MISKAAKLHLQIKHKQKVMKHQIIDFGESIEEFYMCRRQYRNIKDIGQNQMGEVIKEFSLVKKTNDETILYISTLANMVTKLKREKDELERRLSSSTENRDPITQKHQIEKLEDILANLHSNKDL